GVARFAGRTSRLLLRNSLHVLSSFFVRICFERRLALGSHRLLEHLQLGYGLRRLAPVGAVGFAKEVAQSAQTESWHAILPVAGAIMAVQNNATHGGAAALGESLKPRPAHVARAAQDGKGGNGNGRGGASLLSGDPYVAAMASLETPRAAGTPVPVEPGFWRAELSQTIRLALPMALTQVGQVVMMTTDLVLIGRLGDEALAAAALAHTVLFAAFTLGMGVVAAVAPLVAQAFGARRPRMGRRGPRLGPWGAGLPGGGAAVPRVWGEGVRRTLRQFGGEDIVVAWGKNPQAAALAGGYLAGMAGAITPAWAFIACRNFRGAVTRRERALWIPLAAIPANAGLAYLLIY